MILGSICAVTTVVPDLAPIEKAYTELLGCRVLSRGTVQHATAIGWGAPGVAGCRFLVLVAEVGDETSLRFIEDPSAGPCSAFMTHGWNATEITVQDTDDLATRLEGSAFRIIGSPRNLTGFDWIRAMQVLGPAGECLYLTDVGGDASLAAARGSVGQVFIAVVGGADILALSDFYATLFDNPVSPPVSIPIGVINDAHGLPAQQGHALALVELPAGTRIELDQYPPSAVTREVRPGRLPPGMCMVSFHCDDLAGLDLLAPAGTASLPPFDGGLSGCLKGPAGELIELWCRTPAA